MASTNSFTESFTFRRGSYGAGLAGCLTFGYRFTNQLAVEAGATYLAGKTYQRKELYSGSFTGQVTSQTHARMPAFSALMVVSTSGQKWQPFAKAGIIAGSPKIYNKDHEAFNNDVIDREWEIHGKVAWGFQGGLGLNYALSPRFGLFVEGLFRSLFFVPEKGTVTSYIKNGEDQYNTLTVRQRELRYRQSYSINSNPQNQANQPGQTGNDPLPFGTVGLQVGAQLNLR